MEREEESRMRRVGGSDNEIESERKRERGDNKIQHLFLLFLTKALTNKICPHMTNNLSDFFLKSSVYTFSFTLMIYANPTSAWFKTTTFGGEDVLEMNHVATVQNKLLTAGGNS